MRHIRYLLIGCVAVSSLSLAPSGFAAQPAYDSGLDNELSRADTHVKSVANENPGFFKNWLRRHGRWFSPSAKSRRPAFDNPLRHERSLDEPLTAHFDSVKAGALLEYLAPPDWSLQFDVDASRLDQLVVFHAETSRRKALDILLSRIGMRGIFYPRSRIIIIAEGNES